MALLKAGFGRLIDPNKCKVGEVVVKGYYIGDTEGQFGPIGQFIQKETNEKVGLPLTGQLKFVFEKEIETRYYVEIEYRGKETMQKGKFKGKSVHSWDTAYDPDDLYGGQVGKGSSFDPDEGIDCDDCDESGYDSEL